jgi:NAD(P)H-dependent FMN reductase
VADVVLYNEDFDQPRLVAAAGRLRTEVESADALLLVTPEYNGTMSAALKNAIDWISRPSPSRCRKSWPLSPPRSPVGMTEAPANECATLLIG